MARHIAAGIDIGTFETKAVIAEEVVSGGKLVPKIIGTGIAETRGMKRGFVTDPEEAARSVQTALRLAEKSAGLKVKRAHFSISGIGLSSTTSSASIIISRADMEITDRDLEAALSSAESAIPREVIANKKVLNSIPLEHKVDGKVVWGRVEGLTGQKLEIKALFLLAEDHHLQDIVKTAEVAGVDVTDVVAGPVAASLVTLSKRQKRFGCVLVDIGSETTDVVVYENDNIASLEVFPVGGIDLTNKIALGLKTSLEEGEVVKRGGLARISFQKKKLDDILGSFLGDLCDLVEEHLTEISRNALLPAGAVITGGSSNLPVIRDFFQEYLKLPAQVAEIHFGTGEQGRIRENIWATACGLALIGLGSEDVSSTGAAVSEGLWYEPFKKLFRKLGQLISQVLP